MVRKRLLASTANAESPASATKSPAIDADQQGRTPKVLREDPRTTQLAAPVEDASKPAAQVKLPDSTGPPELPLHEDLLVGAGAIARFLYGSSRKRRQVYYLFEQNALPGFRWGTQLCARRSTLLEYIKDRENAARAVLSDEAAE
jgi:hypothetical protein